MEYEYDRGFEPEYYTPEPDEFYLGFEYEEFIDSPDMLSINPEKFDRYWKKMIWDGSDFFSILELKIKYKDIRVRKISGEDIRKCGFTYVTAEFSCPSATYYNDGDYWLEHIEYSPKKDNERKHEIKLYKHYKNYKNLIRNNEVLFYGKINNISELKKILKLCKQ